jgi:tRNA threonylcarbamoyladenosine biosynthesis protein TsaB
MQHYDNLLAIESATDNCSVALQTSVGIFVREAIGVRKHAELILPMIDTLLQEASLSKSGLQAIAYGRGPGAFTGVRLAVSVAQGFSFALDLPAIGISSLAAIAQQVFDQHPVDRVVASLDARMGEIYAARFVRDASGYASLRGDEVLLRPEQLQPVSQEILAGSGATAYAAQYANQQVIEAAPHARYIAKLAWQQLQSGQFDRTEIPMPIYLRDKVAQTTAERMDARAQAAMQSSVS